MPTRREVYMPHLPIHSDAARPWRQLASTRYARPEARYGAAYSGLGAANEFKLEDIPGFDSLKNQLLAEVRSEAGLGAEGAVGPYVKAAIGISAVSALLALVALVKAW